MFLGKLINQTKSKSGFIYKTINGNSASYKALAVYGLSVDTVIMTSNIINIPLYYHDDFVGTLGLGLSKSMGNTTKFLKQIAPMVLFLSKYIFENEF
jgi:hypothetical protein